MVLNHLYWSLYQAVWLLKTNCFSNDFMRENVRNNANGPLRHLICVLGDQLDRHASAFDGFDLSQDAVWMAEVQEESKHVWSSKARIVMFLSAMRHFAASLRKEGIPLYFRKIDDPENRQGFTAELAQCLQNTAPQRLIITEPGEFRVKGMYRHNFPPFQTIETYLLILPILHSL